ncbi:MAG TPA: hypothetical protein VFQ53_32895 [Kofleriaceae bacterium]|nr:hypothetical protein [Kofleriaceae bacterium]
MKAGLLIVAMLVGSASLASASCPDKRASCILHEEGVALFLEGKHEQAAAKFAAAIAAEPTARSYLGYAQAVEAMGQIALAYDTMVSAQRYSQQEVQATGGKDVEVNARAERIKYKLGELRAKIGFVWLRVPDGVPPQRVVAVHRDGEGDLAQPLTQWTAVSPGKQVLVASLDDGSKVEVVAQVAAGSQGVVVIPITPAVGTRPQPVGTGRPLASLYTPMPKPPTPVYQTYIAVAASMLTPGAHDENGDDTTGVGGGLSVFYERRLGKSLGLATRLEYYSHGTNEDFFRDREFTGSEVVAMGGVRTMGSKTIHGRALAGFTVYSQTETSTMTFLEVDSFTRAYPAFELGGGLHLGRLRIQMGAMFTASPGAQVSLGTRFMGSIGIDLYRK